MTIEGLTGLKNLSIAFEDYHNYTEVEIIINYLRVTYNFSECHNIYDYLLNVINFSKNGLESINADYEEFYDNMTVDEALEVILNKLISTANDIPAINGFPADFNFNGVNYNTIHEFNGKKWYPFNKGKNNINYNQLLIKLFKDIELNDNDKIVYHGTSWQGALSIMDKVELTSRSKCTDFGFKNFYVTDTFRTACRWTNRHTQAAIVIFVIPENYIESLDNYLNLNDITLWKETVFKIRNPPTNGPNLSTLKKNYKLFKDQMDSKDLISGPIFANPFVNNINDVEYIKYDDYIPYQYSFKETTIDDIDNMYTITLFFKNN